MDLTPSLRGGRRVSWFDVGGLLENSATGPSPTDSVITHDFAAQPRRSSRAFNTVVSHRRAFPPPATRSSYFSQQSVDLEHIARPHHQSASRPQESLPSARSTSPAQSSTQRQDLTTSLRRSSTQTSYDIPSIRDPGGLLLLHTPPSTPLHRTSIHASSYDDTISSLQDAGHLLLSSSPPSSQ